MAKTRRAFTAEFKREVVRQATQPGSRVAAFARDLGVHESVVRRWIEELIPAAPESPFSGLPCNDEQSRELSRMRHEVASRRIARETLANALGRFGVHSHADQAEAAPVQQGGSA